MPVAKLSHRAEPNIQGTERDLRAGRRDSAVPGTGLPAGGGGEELENNAAL